MFYSNPADRTVKVRVYLSGTDPSANRHDCSIASLLSNVVFSKDEDPAWQAGQDFIFVDPSALGDIYCRLSLL
jgi:hypothetical protein